MSPYLEQTSRVYSFPNMCRVGPDLNVIFGPSEMTKMAISYNYYSIFSTLLLIYFLKLICAFWLFIIFAFWSHICTFCFLDPVILGPGCFIILAHAILQYFSPSVLYIPAPYWLF